MGKTKMFSASYSSLLKMTKTRRYFWNVIKTTILFFGCAVIGVYYSMIGPMLPDLKLMVNGNYEEIGRVVAAMNAPFLVSAIVGGLLSDGFRRYVGMILFLAQMLSVVGLFISPWCRALWLLGLMFFVTGAGVGPFTTGGNAWIVWLWGTDSDAPVHSFHFGWGFGAFIAPHVAKPFLSYTRQIDISNSTNASYYQSTQIPIESNSTLLLSTRASVTVPAQLLYPFSIMAVVTFGYSFLYLMLFFKERNELKEIEESAIGNEKSIKLKELSSKHHLVAAPSGNVRQRIVNSLSPSSCTGGRTAFGVQMAILVFVYHFLVVGGERSWGQYLYAYSKESQHKMTTDEATNLQSTFWLCFLISRGVATLVSKWCPPNIMVTIELFGLLGSSIVLACVPSSRLILWIASCAFAIFIAPLFPGAISVYNQYIDITAMVLALSQGGAAFGSMLYNWTTGFLLEYYGPQSLLYFNIAYVAAVMVVYGIMQFVGLRNKRESTDL